jgi:hypothetical protein
MNGSLAIIILLTPLISFGQLKDTYESVEYKDILYAKASDVSDVKLQCLNLVLPRTDKPYPLLLWIGGGAWSYGDRNQEMDLARKFAQIGIAVASVGHRLSPAKWRDPKLNTGIQHPKHVEDVATATKWLYDNADKYGYDRSNIFIGGYSSGGHLASLITLDSTYLSKHGLSTKVFKGVIPISGTYDIPDYYKALKNGGRPELADLHVKAVFGEDESNFLKASPVNYIKNLSHPLLLMCDNNLYNYTKLFESKIRETEFRDVQVVYSYYFTHGELWRDLSLNERSTYRDIIVAFILGHFEKG